ncbi:MAG: glycosyltransferase family 2 protein [Firmicutes bacterium]|nr:glycosyltransferase family 2 protein [Bacillota bacterium]
MKELSVIIINHNTPSLTAQTVDSFIKSTQNVDYEIVVIDNSSDKEKVYEGCRDERVRVYKNIENKGFGNACNIGVKKSVGKYVLFLNSDTLMQEGTIEKALTYMKENITVGCLGIKTLLEDGSFDHGCKRGFPTPFNSFCHILKLDKIFPKVKKFGGYTLAYIPNESVSEVDSVSGAFMLIPRYVLNRTGLFDESIFMYAEDIDLCLRIKEAGYKVVYYGKAYMIHLKGQSGLHTKNKAVIRHFRDGIRIFYDKYYKKKHSPIVTFLMHRAIDINYYMTLLKAKIHG